MILCFGVIVLGIAVMICVSMVSKKTDLPFYFTMDICSENGVTKDLSVHARRIDNGIDPVHYRGTVSVGGVEYIDHISRFNSAKTSVLDRIKERRRGISYDNFYPQSGSIEEYIQMTYLYDDQGQLYIKIRHFGDSSTVYYGSCNNAQDAKLMKEKFDRYLLSGGEPG